MCVMVDCWRSRTGAAEFLASLGTAVLDRYLSLSGAAPAIPLPGGAHAAEDLAEIVGAARDRVPPVIVAGLEALRDLARGAGGPGLWDGVVDLPQRVSELLRAPVVIALDEFQELARLPRPRKGGLSGQDVYAVLRSRWQGHEGVMYLVAGSRVTALRELLFDEHAPFFQHFTPLGVGPFDEPDARALLESHFAASGIAVPDPVIDRLLEDVGTLPFYLQVVGATLVDYLGEGTADLGAWRRSLDRCLFQPDGVLNLFFRNQFDRVVGRSGMLARVLVALREPLALGDLAERIGTSSGAAGTYVRRLAQDDAVTKEDGRYVVPDPCFRLWLQSQEDLGGLAPPSIIGDISERRVTEALAALGLRVIYQSRASRGAFDLLGLAWGRELAIQVKTGEAPVRVAASEVHRMQDEARRMGWIPLLAVAGSGDVLFFDLASVNVGRKKTVSFGAQIEPIDDILALVR